ncbi:unnamed protein product [Dibothriocephalus latus]|uniref:Uncharacterized protein n=1 Tax=Dibothriocephalus latus TaxID=60516 RepID=A0A3P7L0Y1_DIBLA|nr:unnamed protein product [Dibothriocephalus latus]
MIRVKLSWLAVPFLLKTVGEHLFSVEPGLSTFAKFPSEAIDNLRPLVEYAQEYVPEEWRSSTPIILRATAGLRLLPEKSANDLLASNESVSNFCSLNLSSILSAVCMSVDLAGETEGVRAIYARLP